METPNITGLSMHFSPDKVDQEFVDKTRHGKPKTPPEPGNAETWFDPANKPAEDNFIEEEMQNPVCEPTENAPISTLLGQPK